MKLPENRRRLVLGAALLAVTAASVVIFQPRETPATMLACLPPGEGPVVYVDVSVLRKTGLLEQIAGQPDGEDPEYKRFVEASGFNYRRDLDAALVELREGGALMVLKGRFDPERLTDYAKANGGECAGAFCSIPGSQPPRRISFHPLGGRLMALATGSDPMAAAAIKKDASAPMLDPPGAPVWMNLPASSFHAQADLPLGVSAFLEALDGAQRALLTVEMNPQGFDIVLAAPCPAAEKASAIEARLSGATGKLKELVARSGKTPPAASPASVLAAGTFRTDQTVVRGRWPLSKAFFEAALK